MLKRNIVRVLLFCCMVNFVHLNCRINKTNLDDIDALELFTDDIDNLPKPEFKLDHPIIKYGKMAGVEVLFFCMDCKKCAIDYYKKIIRAIMVLRYNL